METAPPQYVPLNDMLNYFGVQMSLYTVGNYTGCLLNVYADVLLKHLCVQMFLDTVGNYTVCVLNEHADVLLNDFAV